MDAREKGRVIPCARDRQRDMTHSFRRARSPGQAKALPSPILHPVERDTQSTGVHSPSAPGATARRSPDRAGQPGTRSPRSHDESWRGMRVRYPRTQAVRRCALFRGWKAQSAVLPAPAPTRLKPHPGDAPLCAGAGMTPGSVSLRLARTMKPHALLPNLPRRLPPPPGAGSGADRKYELTQFLPHQDAPT